MKMMLVSLILLWTFNTLSGQVLVLDVDQAVDKALANNLDLKSERLNLKIKKRAKDTFWNFFVPTTTGSAALHRSNEEPMDLSAFGIAAPPRWEFSFSLNATLTLTSQLYFGIKKTFLDYEEGLISVETAQKQLALAVRKAFYNLILLLENMNLMKQNIETAKNRYEQAKINYENGLVSEYDMLSAQVAFENLKPGLKDMEIGYKSALSAFKQLLGISRKTELRIEGSISADPRSASRNDPEALIKGYVDNRLDILALKAAIKSLENLERVTFTSFFPSVTLSYLMDPTFQGDPFSDPWFANGTRDWEQQAGGFSVTISLSLDALIPNSQTQIKLADNRDAVRQTAMSLAQARQGAEIEIETLVLNLEKSIESIETLKLNVKLAERAYTLAEEAYNAGSRELLEVQNADLELQKARLEVLKEEYNYTIGLLDLEYAINSKLNRTGNITQ